MKHLFIIIAVILIAAFAYQQFSSQADKQTANQTDSQPQVSQVNTQSETVDKSINKEAATDSKQTTNQQLANSLISASAPDAAVYFIEPSDGAVLSSPISIKFGVRNMKIVPAGTNEEFSGHHHILVDLETLPDLTQALPATDQIIHYGGGQTETTLELSPGTHTLQLLLGNFAHVPHDTPVLSEKISITVQ